MIQKGYRPASLQQAVDLHETKEALYLAGGTYVNWAASGLDPKEWPRPWRVTAWGPLWNRGLG